MNTFLQYISEYKPLVDVLQALLTPVIGVAVAFIAAQQRTINRRQLQLTRYDRQFKVYRLVTEFLREILNSPIAKTHVRVQNDFIDAVGESHFVFDGDEIANYLVEMRKSAFKLARAQRTLRNPRATPDDKQEARNIADELEQYFERQLKTEAREKFKKHLKLQ